MTKNRKMIAVTFGVVALNLCAAASLAFAADPVDKEYVRALAVPGHFVFVMEYWQGNEKVVARHGLKTEAPFTAVSATEFAINEDLHIALYGVEPCAGRFVSPGDRFDGSCDDYGRMQLQIFLRHPKVVYCRAFIEERLKAKQEAACYAHHHFPGALNSVDLLEDQLVSVGALRLSHRADGSALRPDLEEAEKIAKHNRFGLWSRPQERP